MFHRLLQKIKRRKYKDQEIAPDEIFLDSSNLPDFDRNQFEGRLEKPITRKVVMITGILFAAILPHLAGVCGICKLPMVIRTPSAVKITALDTP